MKSIFYILSAVIIAASAYFTWSNSQKLNAEISLYDDTFRERTRVDGDIETTSKDLKDTEGSLATAKDLKAERQAELESGQSKYTQIQKEMDEYVAELEDLDAELKKLDEAQKKIQEALKGIDVPWDQVGEEIGKLKDKYKQRSDDLEQLKKLVANLKKDLEEKRGELFRQNQRLTEMRKKIDGNAKIGSVTAVRFEFGFVVVSFGEKNSNITPESKLIVTRGGRRIGELTPTSIEPLQTVCDLNLKDFVPGVRIQRGDRVVIAETVGS